MDLYTLLLVLFEMLWKYDPQELDPKLKPIDSADCTSCRNIIFDFIIVGAGSAGCILANRLSENEKWNILLMEAGGDENFITDVPAFYPILSNTKFDWNYTTVKQERFCLDKDGMCISQRGHTMGGSSTVNGMVYVRGNPQDYDGWEALGNLGWNYKQVLPYFRKAENMTIPELAEDNVYHSTKGPLPLRYSVQKGPLKDEFLQAGIEYGLSEVDYNGPKQEGIAEIQYTLKDHTRCSLSKAYLDPIRNKTNLFIFKNTLVNKLLFSPQNESRVIGVNFETNGTEDNVYASKEVILSAGTLNTPKLLILSGIGPKEELKELQIPLVADLPVGKTLVDHAQINMRFRFDFTSVGYCEPYTNQTVRDYAEFGTGDLTATPQDVVAYINGYHQNYSIHGGLYFGLSCDQFNNTKEALAPIISVLTVLLNPKSTGTLKLSSKNNSQPPLIDPNFFSSPWDKISMRWIMRGTLKFMQTPTMSKFSPELIVDDLKGCKKYYNSSDISDQFLDCYYMATGVGGNHQIGTARMGTCTDKTTVVDWNLKVHTMENLRVIDASIMPVITRGNTNAPTVMIAEKASDNIKRYYESL